MRQYNLEELWLSMAPFFFFFHLTLSTFPNGFLGTGDMSVLWSLEDEIHSLPPPPSNPLFNVKVHVKMITLIWDPVTVSSGNTFLFCTNPGWGGGWDKIIDYIGLIYSIFFQRYKDIKYFSDQGKLDKTWRLWPSKET